MFDEAVLQDILNRINIVEVISEYMPLKRAGRNFKAVCPFHHEKTASFVVSAEKQIFHCFGCGAGGNVFGFLMQYERLAFGEAVELLARRSGVTLPQRRQGANVSPLISQLHKVNELAARFYQETLAGQRGQQARAYLVDRGILPETAQQFGLGFAPDNWDALTTQLRSQNVPLSLLEKAGLSIPRREGGYYDRFRNRVIFPISDVKNACIGFGARVMDKGLPKYINSPETAVYRKGSCLYNFASAKDAVRRQDRILIVEGYLDCIVPFQYGVHNIVASLGTALTPEQARLIRRYTNSVVMVYDGDLAGELATLRSLEIFLEEGMQVAVAALPAGFDPDSLVRKNGIEDFNDRLQKAESLFDYKLRILRSRFDCRTVDGKAAVCADMLPTIRKVGNAIIVSEYLKKLAETLKISESSLAREMEKLGTVPLPRSPHGLPAARGAHPTERLLMKLMLEETELVSRIKGQLDPSEFQDAQVSRIVATMFDLVTQGKDCHAHSLIAHLGEEELSQTVCASTFLPEVTIEDREKIVDDCIVRLKKNSLSVRRRNLQEAIAGAEKRGDEEELARLKEEFNCLIKKK